MSAKVYVGNLSWNTTDDTLRDAFGSFGQVLDVRFPYATRLAFPKFSPLSLSLLVVPSRGHG